MVKKRKRETEKDEGVRLKFLESQWDTVLNARLRPLAKYATKSGVKAYWRCNKSTCEHPHVWKTSIGSRFGGSECPFCCNRTVCKCNSIVGKNPEIAALWDASKNGDLNPEALCPGATAKAWFWCKNTPCDHHKWQAQVCRAVISGCPFCRTNSGLRLVCPCTSLATTHPEIAAEWHPTKNGDLTPDKVIAGSTLKAWWKCSKHTTCDEHEWETHIFHRKHSGCPFCMKSRRKPCRCQESFGTTATPELLSEWHPMNPSPTNFTPHSGQIVLWRCSRNTMHPDWKGPVYARARGGFNCSSCFPAISAGEFKMYEVLTELFGEEYVLHNRHLPRVLPRLKEKNSLRFDCIVLPDLDNHRNRYMFFEYDGEQHFRNNNMWKPSISRRDRLKNFWAVRHDMHFLRIGASKRMNVRDAIERFLARVERCKPQQTIIQFKGKEYDDDYTRCMMPIIELSRALVHHELHLLISSYIS